MRLMTAGEAAEWCGARGIEVARSYPFGITFRSDGPPPVRIAAPGEGLRVLALAAALASSGEDGAFAGGVAWLLDWDIWSPETEAVGHTLLRALRASHPDGDDLRALPAHRFEAADGVEARAFLALPLLFQWDAVFIPHSAGFAAFLSHDGWIEITARSAGARGRVMERVRADGWEIVPEAPEHGPPDRADP